MKLRQFLLIPLIVALICIPALSVQAQDDNPPPPPQYDEMDDDFIDALVMMSVNHNLLEGKNEIGELNDLKDIVGGYYNNRLSSALQDDAQRTKLNEKRDEYLAAIDKRKNVVHMKDREFIMVILHLLSNSKTMTGWAEESDESAQKTAEAVPDSGTDPYSESDEDGLAKWANTMQSRILTDAGETVNMCLGIDTISAMPSLAPAISDSSGWSYNVPAITNSTPSIGNSGSSSSGDNGSSTSPGDSSSPVNPPSGESAGSGIIEKRPVRFTNNGFEPVTVVVESYEPAPGLSPAIPAGSTVVTPETNSSASLELPLGTYTFCYYWQLDEDYNNDDYFDYHHRTTSAYTLNNNSSNDMQSAIAVGLSPDSNVSNPNGKCGENLTQDTGDLTPEELANQGTHQWLATCVGNDEYCDGTTEIVTGTIIFSSGTVIIDDGSEEADVLVRVGLNTYTLTSEYDVWTYIFTKEGFELSVDFTHGKLVYTLQD